MSAYIKHLNVTVTEEQAAREEIVLIAAENVRARLTPLEDRVEKLLTTIPADVQREGLALNALQTSLRGRWRGTCHPGELGAALRKLGYVRRRQWNGEDGFRALWYPIGS